MREINAQFLQICAKHMPNMRTAKELLSTYMYNQN